MKRKDVERPQVHEGASPSSCHTFPTVFLITTHVQRLKMESHETLPFSLLKCSFPPDFFCQIHL